MKISITLPSIHPDALPGAIANINATTRNEHQIIVVSPFEARGDNVQWIEERRSEGPNFAHYMGAGLASGEFITAMVDDWHYVDGWDEIVIADYEKREEYGANLLMGVRYTTDDMIGTNFGIYYATFPFMRRRLMTKYSWLTPEYRVGFGDSDFSMRVWMSGGRVEFSEQALLYPVLGSDGKPIDGARKKDRLFTDDDMNLFLSRWAPRYGKGWDTTHLRGFNLDFNINKYTMLNRGQRTVYYNDPEFRQMIGA